MTSAAPSPRPRGVDAPFRVRALLEAHRLINSDLSLDAVLSRIVRTACDLVDSPFGALGVLGPDGALQGFVTDETDGPDEQLRALSNGRPDTVPAGRGLRTVLLGDPDGDITADPGVHTVPIRGRDEPYGTLYLARPPRRTFDDEDEQLLAALAATAATAIANARLYEEAQRSRDWLQASGEIARSLLAGAGDVENGGRGSTMLADVAARAQQVANADYGALILPAEDGRLRVTAPAGVGARFFDGLVFDPSESAIGRSIVSGASLLMADSSAAAVPGYDNPFDFGPLMLTPLVDAKGVRGAIVLLRVVGRAQFGARDLDLATTFADHVALALALDEARGDAEALRVLEVRHRIAQDMHDNLIQRLFATGMGLQVLSEKLVAGGKQCAAERLDRHIDELDETIDQVRERIFGLREVPTPTARPRRGPTHVVRTPEKSAAAARAQRAEDAR